MSAGGNGAGGGGVSIPDHTVLSGSPTTDGEGQLVNAGAGVLPAIIALTEALVGAATIAVEGTLMPIPGSVGPDASSLVQVCTGGAVNGNVLEGCHLSRVDFNSATNTAGTAIYDTSFTEQAQQSFTPTMSAHEFRLVVRADPTAQTAEIDLYIDGEFETTISAINLGTPGGDIIGILLAQAVIRSIIVMHM